MKQTLFERIFLNLKTSALGLMLLAGALWVAQTERIAASDKAYLITILAGAGAVLLGVKDPRKPRRRTPAKRP